MSQLEETSRITYSLPGYSDESLERSREISQLGQGTQLQMNIQEIKYSSSQSGDMFWYTRQLPSLLWFYILTFII